MHFLTCREFLVLFDFNELDVKLWEDNLTDIKIEFIFDEHVEVVDVAGVVGVDGDGL